MLKWYMMVTAEERVRSLKRKRIWRPGQFRENIFLHPSGLSKPLSFELCNDN